jgi:ZIP family zinc transporter
MSSGSIAVLGAIAGLTIFLGLPLGRLTSAAPRTKALLTATAAGILVFLLWDVLAHAWEPIDAALGTKEAGTAWGNGLVLLVTFGIGLLGLVHLERWTAHRTAPRSSGPGAVAAIDLRPAMPWQSTGGRLALTIAIGIGLHNFAEGLAIGGSAASGELQLAVLLVIGFGLHNATEGFGIVAPLTGTRPSWGYLALLGLIGGGPTFLGTVIGQSFGNATMSVAFLGLAAGSILYVVIELFAVARRSTFKQVTAWGVFVGVVLGFATDAIITLVGA